MQPRPLTIAVAAAGLWLVYVSESSVIVVAGLLAPTLVSFTRLGDVALVVYTLSSLYAMVLGFVDPLKASIVIALVVAVFLAEPLLGRFREALWFPDYWVLPLSALMVAGSFIYASTLTETWASSSLEGTRYIGLLYRSPEGSTILFLAIILGIAHVAGKLVGPRRPSLPSYKWLLPARLAARMPLRISAHSLMRWWVYTYMVVVSLGAGIYGFTCAAAGLAAERLVARRHPRLSLLAAAAVYVALMWLAGYSGAAANVTRALDLAARSFDKMVENSLP